MIVLYKGRRGCGKTLTMIKDGLNFYQNGYKVLRNFSCSFGVYLGDEQILELDKNSNISNCIIMLDELQIFFDARRSMRKQNLYFSNFIQQVRKRNIIVLATTQFSNTIDLRFRQHTDIVAFPTYYKKLEVCEVIYVDMTSIEDIFMQGIKSPNYVKIVYDAKPLFELYKTEEMIK